MIWLILLASSVLAADRAFWPLICPAQEKIIVCAGDTAQYQVHVRDPENDNQVCDQTTSPEACYFILETPVKGECSIDNKGLITYISPTQTNSEDIQVTVYVYDKNNIQTDNLGILSFDAYNPADRLILIFSIIGTGEFPVFQAGQEPEELYYNKAFTYVIQLLRSGDYKYEVEEPPNDLSTAGILSTGRYYGIVKYVDTDLDVTLSFRVTDKYTQCYSILTMAHYYPNYVPEVTDLDGILIGYTNQDLRKKFKVYDLNDGTDSLTVVAICKDCDLTPTIVWNETEKIYDFSVRLGSAASYVFRVTATDNGAFNNQNVKSKSLSFTVEVQDYDTRFPQIDTPDDQVRIVKSNKDWVFIPEINFLKDYIRFELATSPSTPAIKLLDYNKGSLYWSYLDLNTATDGTEIEISLTAFDTDYDYIPTITRTFSIKLVEPPVVKPPLDLFWFYGKEIILDLEFMFNDPDILSWSINSLDPSYNKPTFTTNGEYQRFTWTPPNSGVQKKWHPDNSKFIVKVSVSSGDGAVFSNQVEFQLQLREYVFPVFTIPDSKLMAYATNDYSLDILDFTDYFKPYSLTYTLSGLSNDISFLFPKFTWSRSQISTFTGASRKELPVITITFTDKYSYSANLNLLIIAVSTKPTISIPLLTCTILKECTWNLLDYIDYYNTATLSNGSLANTWNSVGEMLLENDSTLKFSPVFSAGTSGRVIYSIDIDYETVSTVFEVYVNRPPRIETIEHSLKYLVVGDAWEYIINTHDEDSETVKCDLTWTPVGGTGLLHPPVYNKATHTVSWNTVNIESTTGTVTGLKFEASCKEVPEMPQSLTVYEFEVYKNYRCSIVIPDPIPIFYQNYEKSFTVNVIDTDGISEDISLLITNNRPVTMSIEKKTALDSNTTPFLIKWISDQADTSIDLTFTCMDKSESDQDKPYFTNTLVTTIITKPDVNTVISKPTFSMVEIGVAWNADFEVNASDVDRCEVEQNGLVGMSVVLNKDGGRNVCKLSWTGAGIQSWGVRQTDPIKVMSVDHLDNISTVSFTLYPNDRPAVSAPSVGYNIEIYYGRVYKEYQVLATDANILTYSMSVSPSFTTITLDPNTGLITWRTPDIAPGALPEIFTIVLTMTDNHPTPLSTSVTFTFSMTYQNIIPIPLCPDGTIQHVEVDIEWRWDVDINSSTNNLDEDDASLTYSLQNYPEGMEIISTSTPNKVHGRITWTPTQAQNTDTITIKIIDSQGAYNTCTFKLYPNYRPVIAAIDESKFTFNEHFDWYYHLDISDLNERLETLEIEVLNKSPGIDDLELLPYGLLHWSINDIYPDSSSQYTFDIKVTDNGTPRFFTTQSYSITVNAVDDLPVFTSPIMTNTYPFKQYILDGAVANIKEDSPTTLTISYSDEDTPSGSLTLELFHYPAGMTYTRHPSISNTWEITWTPLEHYQTTGQVLIRVYQTDIPSNKDEFEYIIHNIQLVEDAPVIDPISDVVMTDTDYLVTYFTWSDVDTPFDNVEVTLTGDVATLGVELRGKGTIVRPFSHILNSISGTITVHVTSFGKTTNTSFGVTVNPVNDAPVFTSYKNGAAEGIYNSYVVDLELTASDRDLDDLRYCLEPRIVDSSYGSIELNEENKLVWSLDNDETYWSELFDVRVTDQPVGVNCEDLTSYDSRSLMVCREFPCRLWPQNDLYSFLFSEVPAPGVTVTISGPGPLTQVLFAGHECTDLSSSLIFTTCKLPSKVYGNHIPVYLKNANGWGNTVFLPNIIQKSMPDILVPDSSSLLGLSGEYLIITSSSGGLEDYFSCWIDTSDGEVKEAGYYYYGESEVYCLLPQLSVGSYKVYLCADDVDRQSCSNKVDITVCGSPEFKVESLTGKDHGFYDRSVKIDLKTCSKRVEDIHFRLGEFITVEATSATQASGNEYNVVFNVPPNFYKGTAALTEVDLYVTANGGSMKWNLVPIKFKYTGTCLVSEELKGTKGQFCGDGELIDCPKGFTCDNKYSSVIEPIPCSPGFYQDSLAQITCKICPIGKQCDQEALQDPKVCEAGFICNRKQISWPGLACPPGFYCPEGTNTFKVNFAIGNVNMYLEYYEMRREYDDYLTMTDHWYSRGQGVDPYYSGSYTPQCILDQVNLGEEEELQTLVESSSMTYSYPTICPKGFYCLLGVKKGTNSPYDDTNFYAPRSCQEGYICKQGYGEAFDNDNACPKTYFCPGAAIYTKCKRPSSFEGDQTECSQCICPQGHRCPVVALVKPIICSKGSYQPLCGKQNCENCPSGSYCDKEGMDNIDVPIVTCPLGNYCPESSAQPIPCSPGYYQDELGQSICKNCPPGYYCPSSGMITPFVCEAGTICAAENIVNTMHCPEKYYCGEGTSSLLIDTACQDDKICPTPCPIGNFCEIGFKDPMPCDAGTYQDEGTQNKCKQCLKGNYCPSKGLVNPVICPEGYCCDTTGLVSPTAQCPAGYSCSAGTESCETVLITANRLLEEYLECDPATIFPDSSVKAPIPCPPGTYCPSGTTGLDDPIKGPQRCDTGTYNQFCGKFECKQCPEGFECTGKGMLLPILCPLGSYRSGLVLNCQPCPAGYWSGESIGLREREDCDVCPAGKMCPTEGIKTVDEMIECSAGFVCSEGTVNASELCPESAFCPSGLKSVEEAMTHMCPQGRYCPQGTLITAEKFKKCKDDYNKCDTGYDCPTDKYCPVGTGSKPLACPVGTVSFKNSYKIDDCQRNERATATVYGSVNALKGVDQIFEVQPLTYSYFIWNLTTIPENAETPFDYILILNVTTASESMKVPFIEVDDYSPTRRIPLMNLYKTYLQTEKVIRFAVLAHFKATISFSIEFLNGLFAAQEYAVSFEETVVFEKQEIAERESESSFLSVLSRQSEDYFEQPSNIGISSTLSSKYSEYGIYSATLVYPISISLLTDIQIDTDASPIETYNLWNELSLDYKLYPMDYLPYITDCDEWGSNIPIYKLTNHEECKFVKPSDTQTVAILQPLRVPKGDSCDLGFKCRFSENTKRTGTEKKDLWISASENSLASVFYMTRPQFLDLDYQNAIPADSASNKFSTDYYGTGDLIQVKAVRLDINYEAGMVPRDVKLEIGYFQKSQVEKEILKATLYFSNFDSDNEEREYNFSFTFFALPWYECLNLFAFESYMYYIFILLVCVVILGLIFAFWAVNYAISKTYPRPSLKIKLYLNYSLNALKGILMGIAPIFILTISMSYFLNNLEMLKLYSGDHDDKEPIDPNDPQDVDRVTKYLNGRIGWVLFICSWYVIFKTSAILFPKPEAVQNEEDRPRINEEMLRLKGLFLWSLIPVLVFCLATLQFSQSEVFGNYGPYFIIVFKMMNTKLVDTFKMRFGDDLFVLPYFGAMTLTIMMITVEVGEFTKFLQGYLTQIGIKIFKRAFIEPSRLNIKNRITRLKARFGLKTGLDPVEGLSFKDQVYIEQLEDLGRNSMEYIAAWLFPSIIVFQYFFYDVLKIPTSKDFFQYFIILSLIQAFSEILYDIFLNNAIECKTGRLLSEKITDLTKIFKGRKTRWALSDKTVHTGKKLLSRIDTIQRMGFSTQYFFLMSLMTLGVVMQLFGYQIWVKWSYNPLKDPTTIVMIPIFIGLCMLVEYLAMFIGNKLKIWQLDKDDAPQKESDFYDVMKYYIDREIEFKVRSKKGEILKWAMSKLILDIYRSENEDTRRKAAITRFLKKLEEAIQSYDHYEGAISNEPLGIPKIRKQTPYLKVKRIPQEKSAVSVHGDWPDQLTYPWESPSFSKNFAFIKTSSS